jgi:hypothetical protein
MSLKLAVQTVLPAEFVDAMYDTYAAAFAPLQTRAAARHMLTVNEFSEEMADERIEKYVVSGDDAVPVGLGTVATDLSAVPWISRDFFAHRYPDRAARGALFYLGYTLVDPAHERRGIHAIIMDAIYRRITDARGVCGVDLSSYSRQARIGRVLTALGQAPGVAVEEVDTQTYSVLGADADPATTQPVDVQTYYAVTFDGPPAEDADAATVYARTPTPKGA